MICCIKKNAIGLVMELGMTCMLGAAIVLCMSTIHNPAFNVNPWLITFGISDLFVLGSLWLWGTTREDDTNMVEHMFRPTFGALGVLMTWSFFQIALHESAGHATFEVVPVLVFSGLMGLVGILGFVGLWIMAAKQIRHCLHST